MKHLFSIPSSGILAICLAVLTACVNNISDNEFTESNIPITFTAQIKKSTNTRTSVSAFSAGDPIGLYASISGSSIKDNRYINNLRLVCDDNTSFIPEKEVFYPEGNATLDFISYYPYQKEGITEGDENLPVTVQSDQRDNTLSDFMVAVKGNVASSKDPVELVFKHKFARIKIELLPQGEEDVNEMLKANPSIIVTGFKTQANYNMTQDQITDLSNESIIIPSGKWTISTNKLTGMEVIVIPQDINGQTLEMEWNGKLYTSDIPLTKIESSKQYTIQIKATQVTNSTLTSISGSIEDWIDAEEDNSSENAAQLNAIHVATLSFNSSGIYRVYQGGIAVAEICKEYLRSESHQLASQAIVVYPVKNEETVLTEGIVLQLLDEEADIHGGTVSWNTTDNTLDYSPGTSAPISKFFIDENGSIALTKPETPAQVNVSSYTLRDLRKGELQTYSIVKIGTQYWMRVELKTTMYRNGEELDRQNMIGEGAGYFLSDNGKMYFYNGEALLAGELAPEGWKIPRISDWNRLETYTGSVSVLKAGTWKSYDKESEVAPVTNLSGFGAYPVGVWLSTHTSTYEMVGYWSLDETGTQIPQQTYFMIGESDEFRLTNTMAADKSYYKALAIRCLKE